jgi:fatty-acyl-CoA synthase
MSDDRVAPLAVHGRPSPAQAWSRALRLTANLARTPDRILPTVIDELADRHGDAPALLSDAETLTYRGLAERSRQYARWALEQGIAPGDTVALMMTNRPDYMAVWLGITSVGGTVALVNTSLAGGALAHVVNVAGPSHVIVSSSLLAQFESAAADLRCRPRVWTHGGAEDATPALDRFVARYTVEPLTAAERRAVTIEDRALCIYTSGTTGLPKAANVSHGRLMQWSHWFGGLLDTQPTDRMYNCLPMYHSVGGVLAIGAVLVGGGSVVIRDRFSASQFWSDIVRWECTLFQYIGELCRYLTLAPPDPDERAHRLRACCGNGLRPDVWAEFRDRFAIPQILEFYASTEGNVSMFNVEGEPGAIGRVPMFLAHRFPAVLVKFDVARQLPVRDERGRCIRCAPNEVGEAIAPVVAKPSSLGDRFEGYTSAEESARKILRDVFEPGDAWFRTGDLMRRDERGFFYFVDRVGDTFRWKGENVSTSEVAEAISACAGVKAAAVYGVTVPGADGKAGMAAILADATLDLAALRASLAARLPAYARPLFLRLRTEMDMTATLKHANHQLAAEAYDPDATADLIYVDDPHAQAFVRVDRSVYARIQAGGLSSRRAPGARETTTS